MKPTITHGEDADGCRISLAMDGPTADALARAIACSPVKVFPELLELGMTLIRTMPPKGRALFDADVDAALDAVIEVHRQLFIELGEMDAPTTAPCEPGCGCGEGENK